MNTEISHQKQLERENERIEELEDINTKLAMALSQIKRIADYPPRDKAISGVIDGVISEIKQLLDDK